MELVEVLMLVKKVDLVHVGLLMLVVKKGGDQAYAGTCNEGCSEQGKTDRRCHESAR